MRQLLTVFKSCVGCLFWAEIEQRRVLLFGFEPPSGDVNGARFLRLKSCGEPLGSCVQFNESELRGELQPQRFVSFPGDYFVVRNTVKMSLSPSTDLSHCS